VYNVYQAGSTLTLQLDNFVTFEVSYKITSAVPDITPTSIRILFTNRLLNCIVTMTTGLPEPPAAPAGLSNGQITEGTYLLRESEEERGEEVGLMIR